MCLIALTWFDIVSNLLGHSAPCYLNRMKLFLIFSDRNPISERDLDPGPWAYETDENVPYKLSWGHFRSRQSVS